MLTVTETILRYFCLTKVFPFSVTLYFHILEADIVPLLHVFDKLSN